jgi:hypothetical protein
MEDEDALFIKLKDGDCLPLGITDPQAVLEKNFEGEAEANCRSDNSNNLNGREQRAGQEAESTIAHIWNGSRLHRCLRSLE